MLQDYYILLDAYNGSTTAMYWGEGVKKYTDIVDV
jgi:hypothetical protein